MIDGYILGIDQSTQGTKVILLNNKHQMIERCDLPHRQIVNDLGWISHNGEEIYSNVLKLIPMIIKKSGIDKNKIKALGISNQRETTIAWDLETGEPLADAVVWQCSRAASVTERLKEKKDIIKEKTGINLSPYFPAAKMKWLMDNEIKGNTENYGIGTMDSYLIYRLTNGKSYITDYSNAARTQLMNIKKLQWDSELCSIFGIDIKKLPEIKDSDFGETDLGGYLDREIPISAVLGDSNGALFAQGCHSTGLAKATYGTGSSVMMNIGKDLVHSKNGLVTSLAWKINGKADYVLEGNLNYTGAVISWLKNDFGIIRTEQETEEMANQANPQDTTYFVPAFSGLGAPYWNQKAKASFSGMTRLTGKKEIVKAALDCIAYQITDVIEAIQADSNIQLNDLKTDGGPTSNSYLMQFQSDILQKTVRVSETEELSAMGVAYLAGISIGLYESEDIFSSEKYRDFKPLMNVDKRNQLYRGWKNSIKHSIR